MFEVIQIALGVGLGILLAWFVVMLLKHWHDL